MDTTLKQFMSTMGTGPKSSDDLSYTEARRATNAIFDDSLKPATFGAFMVAARWKGQTTEELAGGLDHIREEHTRFIRTSRDFHLDVSGRFDGKVSSVNTGLAASILTAACGVPVFTHTGRKVPTKKGTTFLDVLEVLGLPVRPDPDTSRRALDDVGFSYSAQSVYAPELADLRALRSDLGVRSFLNTIESMVNPSNAPVHVGSFYHLAFASRVCGTFERCESQSPDRVTMIQGIEGQTELRSGDCLIATGAGGDLEDVEHNSGDYGLSFTRADLEEIGPTPETGAELLKRLVRGESVPPAYRESVLWNTTARLLAADAVDSVRDGIERAREILESGRLATFWEDIEEVFNRDGKTV